MGLDYYGLPQDWSESAIRQIIESEVFRNKNIEKYFEEICSSMILDNNIERDFLDENQSDTSNQTEKPKITSCSVQISLLDELGFFELPKIKAMNSTNKEYVISRLLNRRERDVRGNINALNPDSEEDLSRYTSPTETTKQKVSQILSEKNS